ncbi:hypothetical protein OH76DRAFT_216046 [Lentinus brumalis]|uniref:Uncharacterized protein n=1 Tax=Lentinus brumalis TaxID=2498619 RepID=A0A371CMG7_9APHY|nr:hypothetical protein OH76DRAFT_216046 [Polyporus brumalis]
MSGGERTTYMNIRLRTHATRSRTKQDSGTMRLGDPRRELCLAHQALPALEDVLVHRPKLYGLGLAWPSHSHEGRCELEALSLHPAPAHILTAKLAGSRWPPSVGSTIHFSLSHPDSSLRGWYIPGDLLLASGLYDRLHTKKLPVPYGGRP